LVTSGILYTPEPPITAIRTGSIGDYRSISIMPDAN
jgi:hypothetical protein